MFTLSDFITFITPVGLLALVGQAIYTIRYFYRRTRDAEIGRKFVSDMATNHLPHIYDALNKIANHFQIELPEPPPIQFIEFQETVSRKGARR